MFSSFAFAQSENKEAFKIDEFGTLTECDLENRLERSFREFYSASNSKIQVIFYQSFNDSKREHLRKLRFVKRGIAFLREVFNPQISSESVEIVEAGYKKDFSVQLWIIPKGAEPPKLDLSVTLFDSFGLVSEKVWKSKFDKLQEEILSNPDKQVYLVTYGSKKEIDKSARHYLDYLVKVRILDLRKYTVVYGGFSKKQKTEIWIVPPGVEAPAPNPNR